MKFWNLKTNSDNAEAARLDLFGIIGADGFWEDGFDETSFKSDMEQIQDDKALEIFINSDGGSVFTALTIYNMLRRHKGNVTITVAGIAASASTIITSVPNAKVIMPAGSMMMIHAPSAYAGQANAAQLRSLADTLDKVGGSIVDIYKQKTSLSGDVIAEMMTTDTYLTAKEAVDLGFADVLDETFKVAAVRDNGHLIVNGLELYGDRLKHIPAAWAGEKEKEVSSMTTYEEFKEQHPDFYAQAKEEGRTEGYAAGVEDGGKNERERIKAIEDMALVGHEALVMVAKFDKPVSPETFAMTLVKAEKEKAQDFLAKRKADGKALDNVGDGSHAGMIQNKDDKGKSDADEIKRLSAICKYNGGM